MRVLRVEGQDAKALCEEHDAVAIRPDAVGSIEEIELAMHLAADAFQRGTNIAKRMKYEFLLWLSGTRDIKNALRRTAPEGKEFLLIAFSDKRIEVPHERHGLREKADPLSLERISLSRITG